jgi:hypothetical protein
MTAKAAKNTFNSGMEAKLNPIPLGPEDGGETPRTAAASIFSDGRR